MLNVSQKINFSYLKKLEVKLKNSNFVVINLAF
jgi:hypothetical protein